VKWVAFLEWGLDWLQLVSQKIPKHPKTSQNIPKHLKTYQNIPKSLRGRSVQKCAPSSFFGVFGCRFFSLRFVTKNFLQLSKRYIDKISRTIGFVFSAAEESLSDKFPRYFGEIKR
jgi:hypothetical protein